MQVLVTGATGFIGAALVRALRAAGHDVVPAARGLAPDAGLAVDFATDHDEERWRVRLGGVDAVVNAVGIFRQHGSQSFEALHVAAPRALFAACAAARIARVVQLSALGADVDAASAFHRSKKRADDELLERVPTATVVQPSLVFGPGGASSALFLALAALPLVALPRGGRDCVQPIHVDDLCALVVRLVEAPKRPIRVAAVGPEPLALHDWIRTLRTALGWGRARIVGLPDAGLRMLAALRVPWTDRDADAMLARGNCADPAAAAAVLGAMPRPARDFVAADAAPALRALALQRLLAPLVRASVAIVWIWSGVVSLGLHPVDDSLALLAATGVPAALAPVALYAAAGLDVAFGVGTYALSGRALAWNYRAQIATVLVYTAILTVALPAFWIHPFGPLVKNLPFLAALAWLEREAAVRR